MSGWTAIVLIVCVILMAFSGEEESEWIVKSVARDAKITLV